MCVVFGTPPPPPISKKFVIYLFEVIEYVLLKDVMIYEKCQATSSRKGMLFEGQVVSGDKLRREENRLHIFYPMDGWIFLKDENNQNLVRKVVPSSVIKNFITANSRKVKGWQLKVIWYQILQLVGIFLSLFLSLSLSLSLSLFLSFSLSEILSTEFSC